jgi:Peptidase M76 family
VLIQHADSKPRAILQAMMRSSLGNESLKRRSQDSGKADDATRTPSLHWEPTPDGVAIAIPSSSPDSVLRRWTQLHPPPLPLASPTPSLSSSQQGTEWEWLHVSCRDCVSEGPEGGARAFVMGPYPLSVVVCTNRLSTALPPDPKPQQLKHQQPQRQVLSSSSSSPSVTMDESLAFYDGDGKEHATSSWSVPSVFPLFASSSPSSSSPPIPAALQAEVSEILTHELMHVYDVRTRLLDLRDCESLAYSEVRAAAAAECSSTSASNSTLSSLFFSRRNYGSESAWFGGAAGPGQNTACIRRKALRATSNMFPSMASSCVSKVFPFALLDVQPFKAPATETADPPLATTNAASTTPPQRRQESSSR